jgi:3'(2'), 5'-bisphosphate nucleotidase
VNQQAEADREIAGIFTTLATEAAHAILRYDCRKVSVRSKADESPVTAADEAAHSVIVGGLKRLLPAIPVVSEEASDEPADLGGEFILVDPLDGTREFIAGRDEYTVNIALLRGGVPVAGVVAAPALGLIWRGVAGRAERLTMTGGPAERISTRAFPATGRTAAASRSHADAASEAFIARFAPVTTVTCGSALKFCRVAEGVVDIYPRLGPTSEWDVAAGHALVVAAGGSMTAVDGSPLRYGQVAEGFRMRGFIAWGDPKTPLRA